MSRNNDSIFDPPKKHSGIIGALLMILLLIVCIGAAAYVYNSSIGKKLLLETEKVRIMGLDNSFEGFTVLHVSDLQGDSLGSNASEWKELLLQKNWNCVICSGDMVGKSGNSEAFLSLIHSLQLIHPSAPIFFIEGDNDPQAIQTQPHGNAEVLADWIIEAQQIGAVYLDAPQSLTVGKKTVWIVPQCLYDLDIEGMIQTLTTQKEEMEAQGKQYENEGGATYRAVCYRLDAMQRSLSQIKLMNADDLQIAVNHMPLTESYVRTELEWSDEKEVFQFRSIHLLLCGHYCAGGWRLPGGKILYEKDHGFLPASDGLVGMQRINSLNQYISPGLGAPSDSLFKSRMLNRPTVTLLKFTSALQ